MFLLCEVEHHSPLACVPVWTPGRAPLVGPVERQRWGWGTRVLAAGASPCVPVLPALLGPRVQDTGCWDACTQCGCPELRTAGVFRAPQPLEPAGLSCRCPGRDSSASASR